MGIRVINRPTGATVGVFTSNIAPNGDVTTTSNAFDIAVFC